MSLPARTARFVMGFTCLSGVALSAHAFDPNEGAEPVRERPSTYRATQPLPTSIVPRRYYNPTPEAAAPAPVAAIAAPVAAVAYAPAPVAAPNAAPNAAALAASQPAAGAVRAVPAEQYGAAQTAPAYNAPAMAESAAPASYAAMTPAAGYATSDPNPAPAPRHRNRFSLGVEGYYDRYKEDVADLKNEGEFGSVTASFAHYFDNEWYAGLEGRGSLGSDDYKSVSGSIDNVKELEFETQLRGGYDYSFGDGRHFLTYSGLGTRYFSDELKGKVTDLGLQGYDRRILQFYLPVGFTYAFNAYGLQWTPNLEYDQLLYGKVQSRLQNIPGLYELNNHQHSGYGVRGELMMGQVNDSGVGWQFGPFFRYWNIDDSDIDSTPAFDGLEPKNTRLQAGAKLKFLF